MSNGSSPRDSAGLRKPLGIPIIFVFVLVGLLAPAAPAGPPFVTDDPEPVDFQHWEVYLASITAHGPDGATGTLPHVEVNYGVVPEVQLHMIAPLAFSGAEDGTRRQYGYGDTELGVKYRFVHETDSAPQIGVFPLVEVPTGDSSRGLGSGQTQVYLPVWLQKTWGKWTCYGGGGYWINPGAGNRDWWFTGILLQRQVAENLAIGAEVFHQTSQQVGARPQTNANLGFTWDLNETEHIMASAGPTLQGGPGYETYFAFQLTFGPKR